MPRTISTHDDEARSSRPKRSRQYETVEEAMLPHVYNKFMFDFARVRSKVRALDTTTLRELIDSEGRLIPEVPALGVPRVAIPRGPRPSIVFEHMDGVYDVPLQEAYNPPGYDQQYYQQY
ncbi:hypothetical protein Tco_0196273 [Tanacetum coccineum]